MLPYNSLIMAVDSRPLNPGVKYNSIIPIMYSHDSALWTDGYIRYESAHLDNVESEKIIPDSHRCLDNPLVIQEVKRILKEALPAPAVKKP
jgi:hypothetical protein